MSIEVRGPIFDGRADRALDKFADDLRREVAQQGYSDMMRILDVSIQHPTPYYETQINVRDEGTASVINDRGVVYGPWLNGTGSRNFPRTRFKGYAFVRRTMQQLTREVPRLSAVVLRRHIREMG